MEAKGLELGTLSLCPGRSSTWLCSPILSLGASSGTDSHYSQTMAEGLVRVTEWQQEGQRSGLGIRNLIPDMWPWAALSLSGPQFPLESVRGSSWAASLRSLLILTSHNVSNNEDSAWVNSNADVKLTAPLIKASGLTPVLMGSNPSHFSRFLSIDISVATFPFLVFTVKSLEQFPYTVS